MKTTILKEISTLLLTLHFRGVVLRIMTKKVSTRASFLDYFSLWLLTMSCYSMMSYLRLFSFQLSRIFWNRVQIKRHTMASRNCFKDLNFSYLFQFRQLPVMYLHLLGHLMKGRWHYFDPQGSTKDVNFVILQTWLQ